MALAKGYTDQQLKERNAAIRTAKASGASRADLNVLRTGTPTKAPVVKKNPVAVVSSGAAKKNMQEVVRPALDEAKAGIEAQSMALTNAKTMEEQKAAALSTSKIDDATKQAKLEEIKQKALLIQKELNTPDEGTTEATNQAINPTPTGEVSTPPTDNSSSAPTVSDTLTDTQAAYQKALQEYEQKADAVSKTILSIQNGSVPLSAGEKAQVKGLEQQFKALIDSQKLSNISASNVASVRGYQTGAAEYDPNFTVQTIGSIVSAGNNKVADLNIKMASAVAELEQAFKDNKISAVRESFAIFKEASEQRRLALKETINDAQAAIIEAQKAAEAEEKAYIDQVVKPKNDLIKEAAKNGASASVIQAMNAAPDYVSAVIASAGYLAPGKVAASVRSGTGSAVPASRLQLIDANGKPIKLTATQIDTLAAFENTEASANKALQLLNEGANTGIISGNLLQGAKILGNAEEKQLKLEQTIGKLKADFIKSISGAAASESEVRRLSKFLPDITDSEQVIYSKLNSIIEATKNNKQIFREALGGTSTEGSTVDYETDAKSKVDTTYSTKPENRKVIESLYEQDFTDAEVLEYLQAKNLI